MDRRSVRLATLLAVVAVTASACLVEPPYTSGQERVPFAVTLTAADPVAVRDIVIAKSAFDINATSTLELHAVDPRVRVSVVGAADVDSNALLDGVGAFYRPNGVGDLTIPLRVASPCDASACQNVQRLRIELTEPIAADSMTVSGEVASQYGYQGSSPRPGPALDLSGFDSGETEGPPQTIGSRIAGTPTTLDIDHPLALQPIHFSIDFGSPVDPLSIAGESIIRPSSDMPQGAADLRVYPADPVFEFFGVARPMFGTSPLAYGPFLDCRVDENGTCGVDAVTRVAWTGTTPTVPVAYDIETLVASYGATALPRNVNVSTTLGPLSTVPSRAPIATAHHEGSLVLDRGAKDNRAMTSFRLVVADAPSVSNPAVFEVPGVVMLTYSAVGKGGPDPSGGRPVQLSTRGYGSPELPSIEVPLDGQSRVVALGLLAACRPGASCTQDFFFELFPPVGSDASLPVTLTYSLDARLTSFDERRFGPTTTISMGPKPAGP